MSDDTSPPQEAPAPAPPAPAETPAAAPPAAAPPAPEPAPAVPLPDVPVVAEYVAESGRTYHFPGAPQTAVLGDVCQLPYLPADGCWKPSSGPVTRLPDNHPDNQPAAPDPDLVATSAAEHYAILERLGLTGEGGAQ